MCCHGCGRDTTYKDGLCRTCGGREPRNDAGEDSEEEFIRRKTDDASGDGEADLR